MTQPIALAVKADVVLVLGRALTTEESNRADAVLLKASALFRREARQTFTPDRTSPRLCVIGGRVYLPERPVTEVHSVTDDLEVTITSWSRKDQWLVVDGYASDEFLTVDYSHGATEVPDLVRLTVAEVAMKVLTIGPAARVGAESESTGPFSITYATWARGGQTALAPEDKAVARSFRPRVPKIHLTVPSTPVGDRFGSQLPGLL